MQSRLSSRILSLANRCFGAGATVVVRGALCAICMAGPAACGGDDTTPGSTPPVPHDPPAVSTSPGTDGAVPLVDVFVGTGDSSSPDPVGNGRGGSTFPGAALPFGRVQWSPDTPAAAPPGYYYPDKEIVAFSMTHLSGAGCPSLRDLPIFPSNGPPDPSDDPSASFSHDSEIASPGFYEVTLDSGIRVDLTATQRTGLARFTFPDGADAHVLLSSGTKIDLDTFDFDAKIVGDDLVTGSRTSGAFCTTNSTYRLYFAARFDRPFASFGDVMGHAIHEGSHEAAGQRSRVWFRFETASTHVVQMKVGLSYVSVEGALANLDAEDPDWDFDSVHTKAIVAWNDYLGRMKVEGGKTEDVRSFYTALYHVLLQPAVFSDVDGAYVGFDGKQKNAGDRTRYANFSGWDVYRSWIHLVSILAPREASDFVQSLVEAGSECGALPKWALANDETGVMVGDPADPFIAGAYAFGAREFDVSAALKLMQKGADDPAAKCNHYAARPGLGSYLERHYCAVDAPDATDGTPSTTLEYSLADAAIAELASAAGDDAVFNEFLARGQYWKNVFDPTYAANGFQGYVLPRNYADVAGEPSFVTVDPADGGLFTEGNATQYTFMVPQDPYGLVTALGGDATAVARLDALFKELNAGVGRPYFYMGNEPQFGTPWLYVFAGAPWRTQAVVRDILTQVFAPTPEGLPGNDDLGATSAWQVWAMLGLYPVMPGTGLLVANSPLFPKVTITLPSGGTVVVTANGSGQYVQALKVDGKPHPQAWTTWDEIAKGATLDFELGDSPNQTFGASVADRPPARYP